MNIDIYSKEVEEHIISIMLTKQDKISSIIDNIEGLDFYDKRYQYLFNVIANMHKSGKTVDMITVLEQIKFEDKLDFIGGQYVLNELSNIATTTDNLKQLLKTLIKYSKKRRLLNLLERTSNDIYDGVDIDEVLNKLTSKGNDIIYSKISNHLVSLFQGVDEVMEQVNTCLTSEDKLFGLSTGFKEVDKRIGGLCPSKLYIIAARARVGKSALAQQIAEYVAQKKNVLFQSLEMKADQYTRRSLFRRAGITQEMLTHGLISNDEAQDKLASASIELNSLNLMIDDTPLVTLETIEKNINTMKELKGSCDLVVIDYAQLMSHQDRRLNQFQKATENSMGLKRMANKYNVPILLLCQLNRNIEQRANPTPMLSDLKDSGSYEQDADVIMFIDRRETYDPNPIHRGRAQLFIAKNREGSCCTINMSFNGSKTEFKEI